MIAIQAAATFVAWRLFFNHLATGMNATVLPETLIQRQLDAYNDRDIDTFMTSWAQDAGLHEHPDKLLARGHAQIRERHVVRFKEPNLRAKLVSRMVMGNFVVDQEVVTRTFPEGTGHLEVIGIYEVADGKIANAWFRMGAKILDVPF